MSSVINTDEIVALDISKIERRSMDVLFALSELGVHGEITPSGNRPTTGLEMTEYYRRIHCGAVVDVHSPVNTCSAAKT
jgi:hypothetical protein